MGWKQKELHQAPPSLSDTQFHGSSYEDWLVTELIWRVSEEDQGSKSVPNSNFLNLGHLQMKIHLKQGMVAHICYPREAVTGGLPWL